MIDETIIGFGVAGNFAGHLEQAGEASDFTAVKTKEEIQPKAIFPFYVPSSDTFLGQFPLSSKKIKLLNEEENFQIEPEVAVLFEITYENNKVSAIKPLLFGAYNDCSIRREGAKKISEKKNWGQCSKGLSDDLFNIDHFGKNGVMDNFRIASFLKRGDELFSYGEDSPIIGYNYFHEKLIDWIIDRMNKQQDEGPAENIASFLKTANYPRKAIISIGATRYTDFGESNFLKLGDKSVVVVYDQRLYDKEDIFQMSSKLEFKSQGISALVQEVV